MKKGFRKRASICGALALTIGTLSLVADPLLPYSVPIADKLTNEIDALEATPDRTPEQNRQLNTDRNALNKYHRNSTKLNTDISILKGLDQLLGENGGFPFLIAQSAHDYLTDFQLREAGLRRTVDISPRSNIRSNAYKQLNAVSNALAKAEAATTTPALLKQLGIAASKLATASNQTARAAAAKVKGSSVYAKIGKLTFNTSAKSVRGDLKNGVLEFVASSADFVHPIPPSDEPGDFHWPSLITRDMFFHVEGVTTDTPAIYELGIGNNFAEYIVTDARPDHPNRVTVVQFYATNSLSNPSVLIIDNIASNYMVGRFSFRGFTTNELTKVDTNQITTITNGEFQLTYTNAPPPPTL